jgi:ribosome-binding protein aMBF1 (putative translation factor)
MARKRKATSDALEILRRRYYEGRPERLAALEHERVNAQIARDIYVMREKAGLTQRELAALVGTTPSVICRLEDADYEGHSLAMLRRIAEVLDKLSRSVSFRQKRRGEAPRDRVDWYGFDVLKGSKCIG